MKWFSYDAEGYGFRLHDTEEEARAAARKVFREMLDEAVDGGWPESPELLGVWGRVHQLPRMIERIETPGGEFDWLEVRELRSPEEKLVVKRFRQWTDEDGDEWKEEIR